MNKNILILLLPLIIISCKNNDASRDATGVFEASELIISSEANGRLVKFDLNEGDELNKFQVLGMVDTFQLYLQKRLLHANKLALLSNKPNIKSQIEGTKKEIEKTKKEKRRIEKLLAGDAATTKQMDDINAKLTILEAKLAAQKSSLNTSSNALDQQANTFDIQIEQLQDKIEKSIIKSPIKGTVLVKYTEENEITAFGKPLFKVANLQTMILRAYLTSSQLTSIKLGQEVKVLGDFGETEVREYPGKITWISSKAEFTPKTIQTQDERANLVYAIKISVKNDGYLKIGMYGGIQLAE